MYLISKQIYLDNHNKCYKTIIIINSKPSGKLANLTTNVRLGKLAETDNLYGCCNKNLCIYAFKSFNNCCDMMCMEEYANLITFLSTNGYTINYKITKLLSKENKNLLLVIE